MNWISWSAFFSMGGYGRYVWGSTLVVTGSIAAELFALRRRRNAVLAEISLDGMRKKNAGATIEGGR